MLTTEFLITSLIVVLIPGTGVLYTVATGLFVGKRASAFAALGCTLGIVPALLASVFGLAAVFHTSALAFQVVKYIGAAYLLYLAWQMWKSSGSLTVDQGDASPQSGSFRELVIKSKKASMAIQKAICTLQPYQLLSTDSSPSTPA